ncbi:hypothetical protein EVAR_19992_1 [Eumeta japonica]|uniref:Uncharacterized protein n=1 Tax=Eumeta variegata TaxID=151549 RepID=A0A4C1VAV7_EUMVA|nr:hypothetical protein EVAR_19992_1 [Eumeta japonica]
MNKNAYFESPETNSGPRHIRCDILISPGDTASAYKRAAGSTAPAPAPAAAPRPPVALSGPVFDIFIASPYYHELLPNNLNMNGRSTVSCPSC